MPASSNEFHMVSHWRVQGSIEEVAAILKDATALPEWWSEVYLAAVIVEPGKANGIGRRVAITAKGRLPYVLKWTATLIENEAPQRWVIAASGDLEGRGEWKLRQDGDSVEIAYDWRVKAKRPILRLLSPILAPLFAWNHRWAMAKGEKGLRREIKLRRMEQEAETAARAERGTRTLRAIAV